MQPGRYSGSIPDIIDPAPALLTRGEGDAEIASICRLEDGQRLVALLSPDRLFRSELVRRILAEQASAGETGSQSEANVMADEQFIIFRLGDQDYGIPIAAVSEIARRARSHHAATEGARLRRRRDESSRQRGADRRSAPPV